MSSAKHVLARIAIYLLNCRFNRHTKYSSSMHFTIIKNLQDEIWKFQHCLANNIQWPPKILSLEKIESRQAREKVFG